MSEIEESRSPLLVAEQILWLRREIDTTPMHVLKLVYLSHGWTLGITGKPLINEHVQAWTYGPVIPSVYYEYRRYGRSPIKDPVIDRSDYFSERQRGIIKGVTDLYKDAEAVELSNITHKRGSPWERIYGAGRVGVVIPDAIIEKYYRQLAEAD